MSLTLESNSEINQRNRDHRTTTPFHNRMAPRRAAKTKVNYDMKFHPADVVLRPGSTRTKRHRSRSPTPGYSAEPETTDEAEISNEPREKRPRISLANKPNYDVSYHPMDDFVDDEDTSEQELEHVDIAEATSPEIATDHEEQPEIPTLETNTEFPIPESDGRRRSGRLSSSISSTLYL